MRLKSGFKKGSDELPIRIVFPHVYLAKDDIPLFLDFIWRQSRLENRIAKHIESHVYVFRRDIDIVYRPIECRVGIDIAAGRLHAFRNFPAFPLFRSLEEHMLQVVRQARTQASLLVDTSRLDPNLGRTQGQRPVRPKENRQAVFQMITMIGFRGQRLQQVGIRMACVQK